MLNGRLVTQTTYAMRLSQFSPKQCHRLDVIVLQTFLSLLKINRSTPRAVAHGPLQYEGMSIFKHKALQDQWGLHYFVQTLRWDKTTANDVIVVLDAYQLASGFITPVLETTHIPIDYVAKHGWVQHIRQRLDALDGEIKVEKAWQPKLQRIRDDSLMEVIASCTALTPKERRLANEFRIWTTITCVSCIAHENGGCIPIGRLLGGWRANSNPDITWPNLPTPTPAHNTAFRRCLRLTLCTTTSPYKRQGSYKLDSKLGKWFIRKGDTLFRCYTSAEGIYWRDEITCYKCKRSPTSNFYSIDYNNQSEPPIESHPINASYTSDGRVWIWKKYLPYHLRNPTPSNHVKTNEYNERPNTKLDLVSDASVHIKDRKAAGAWNLFKTNERGKDAMRRRTVRTLRHQPLSHSYRHELETYYHALQDADTILKLPHSMTQWMDCKAGFDKIETPVFGPRDTMGTDMDIVMAYHALKEKSKHTVSHDWVMGHAKEKKKDKPNTITDMEHVNEDCDNNANDRVEEDISSEPFTPLPGYRVMLKLGDNWVTTLFRDNVQFVLA